ncbi:MAG TPA: hypothetical protein PK760_05300 [Flavobacteriales bacterium]|nr:hypothetical protein [Flavobacteriales bacterium]
MRKVIAMVCVGVSIHAHCQLLSSNGAGGSSGGAGSLLTLLPIPNPADLLNTEFVDHPRDFETRLYFGLGTGLQMANLADHTGPASAGSFPWLGLLTEAGSSVTYRDRFGFALQGGWGFTGYLLTLDSTNNTLYNSSTTLEARSWWLSRACRSCPSHLKFGVAYGFNFQQADVLTREKNGYRSVVIADEKVRPYIAPELGMMGAEGKDRMEVSLRYMIHLDGAKGWQMHATSGTSSANYNASDNYLGLVMRYHIGFKRKVPKPQAPETVPYQDRSVDTLTTMTTRQQRITLRLWDNAEVDGDTISVFLNDVPVLTNYALTKEHKRLSLDLQRGTNRLLVIAHNEGTVPPNTASCIVRRGKGKEQLLIKTSHKKSQVVVIECE